MSFRGFRLAECGEGGEGWYMTTLQRPVTGRVIAGVCAGLAYRFGWKPTTMRVLFLVSCLLPGPQFLLYIALWILMPTATVSADSPRSMS